MNTQVTLAELATVRPGAAQVFHRHRLDFCCGGRRPLTEVCAERGLDPEAILQEIDATHPDDEALTVWAQRPLDQLIEHIIHRYHDTLRAEVPVLVEMAAKVERVHADKPSCPVGLTEALVEAQEELQTHLAKEEQILFPLILEGRGPQAGGPITVLTREHDEHGLRLQQFRALTNDFQPPPEACNTWRSLYLGLAHLETELMAHIHLENNVLFQRAHREEA